MRRAFTLIELMISISILSIMMLFLYKSFSSLNTSNKFYKKEVTSFVTQEKIKEVVFLDFSLSLANSIKILPQDKREDIVFFQSTNSLHRRYNPYIAYIKKDKKLYRLESLHPFKEYPLSVNDEFIVDELGSVKSFRVYKGELKKDSNTTLKNELYLVHIDFLKEKEILLKVKVLNGY